MKKLIISISALMLTLVAVAQNNSESVAQAVWCENNGTLYFLNSNIMYAVGDTYLGQTITNVWKGEQITNSGQEDPVEHNPAWSLEIQEKMTNAVFDESFSEVLPQNLYKWFNSCRSLVSITGLEYLNTSQVTNMDYMFCNCTNLPSLDVTGFDTHQVTSMNSTFRDMLQITSLDLSGFNTSQVTDMSDMFNGCTHVTSFDLSSFDTSNVTSLVGMFNNCWALETVNLSSFNTSKVTNMAWMFYGSRELTEIDLSNFDTSKVTNMEWMFGDCWALENVNLSSFNTTKVTNMAWMFYGNKVLPKINLSNFNTSKVTNMEWMFGECYSMKTIYCNTTWTCASSENMFYNCARLIGENGFSYNSDKVTAAYANPGQNGYFTLDVGGDMSNLLVNPRFNDGFDGWTNADGGEVIGNIGGKDFFPVVECYETIVDIQQTIKAAPGVYAISVYAFERPGGNTQFSGDEPLKVKLFMNQFSTPVQHIVTDAIPSNECQERVNCYRGDGSGAWPYDYNVKAFGWIPNSVDGASYAFNSGRYIQTCYGLVGNDGVMKIGLTSDGVTLGNGGWCLWAGFSLKYMAKDKEALLSIIDYYVNQASTIENASIPDTKTLNNSIKYAQNAVDAEAMYYAVLGLARAYNAALNSVKQYETAIAAYDNLISTYIEYEESATEEAKKNAKSLLFVYADIKDYVYTGTEAVEITNKLNKATSRLIQPDMNEASDENPLDMTSIIVNPTYENANSDGWSGNVPNHSNYNRTDMVEYWHAACNQYQTLFALPAGTYELTVNAFNRFQDNSQSDYNAFSAGQKNDVQTGKVYVTINGEETAIPVRMISEGARTYRLYPGIYVESITLADGTTAYAPNNMQAVGACFEEVETVLDENGNEVRMPISDEMNYINRIVFKLTEECDVTFGIKNTDNSSWMIWDNWTLTYFGTDSKKIPTGALGDVNGDGHINGLDIVEMVDKIMDRPSGTFIISAADFNNDGIINGMDLVKEVALVMSQTASGVKARKAPKKTNPDTGLTMEILKNNDGGISMGVESSDDYILTQFVLELSDGQKLKDITSTDIDHVVAWQPIDGNRFMVICYSMRNATFTDNHNLLRISYEGSGTVRVSDVMLVDSSRKPHYVRDAELGEPTDIELVNGSFAKPMDIYSVSGVLVKKNATSTKGLVKGIYIVDGKTIIIKSN